MRWLVLIAFSLSGAAALIYEVAWTRALSIVLGSTTYALSTMLGTFMAGLALGGYIGGKLADRTRSPLVVLAGAELLIGVFGALTIALVGKVTPMYFLLFKSYYLQPTLFFIFQFFLCAGIMLIPTTLMGATFPLVSKAITSRMEDLGAQVGTAYTSNTLGAIAGSLGAGFLLIPLLGVKGTTLMAAGLNFIAAGVVYAASRQRISAPVLLCAAALIAPALVIAASTSNEHVDLSFYNAGKYVGVKGARFEDVARDVPGTLLWDKEYREGHVMLWRDKLGYLLLKVGAKMEGTAKEDMPNTALLAYLPAAMSPAPRSALVIGLGAGATLNEVKRLVPDVTLVEINDGVVEAVGTHGAEGLLDNVKVVINDARTHLALDRASYDFITSEPSYPADSGTANLFTLEHYQAASQRLNPGGLYAQWLPGYALSKGDIVMMLRTFSMAFPFVELWWVKSSNDYIMLGSGEPFSLPPGHVAQTVQGFNRLGLRLDYSKVLEPQDVKSYIAKGPGSGAAINTDDRPVLEYRVARGFLRRAGLARVQED